MTHSLALLFLMFCAAVPGTAQAHLLPKQNATMRLVDNSVFFVVSVPVSALHDVDDNADGQLSIAEINAHQLEIARQFDLGFHVADEENQVVKRGTWITPPHTGENHGENDYVVVMHRIDFAAEPASPTVSINLFGLSLEEARYSFRASRQGKIEQVVIARESPVYTFFVAG